MQPGLPTNLTVAEERPAKRSHSSAATHPPFTGDHENDEEVAFSPAYDALIENEPKGKMSEMSDDEFLSGGSEDEFMDESMDSGRFL